MKSSIYMFIEQLLLIRRCVKGVQRKKGRKKTWSLRKQQSSQGDRLIRNTYSNPTNSEEEHLTPERERRCKDFLEVGGSAQLR